MYCRINHVCVAATNRRGLGSGTDRVPVSASNCRVVSIGRNRVVPSTPDCRAVCVVGDNIGIATTDGRGNCVSADLVVEATTYRCIPGIRNVGFSAATATTYRHAFVPSGAVPLIPRDNRCTAAVRLEPHHPSTSVVTVLVPVVDVNLESLVISCPDEVCTGCSSTISSCRPEVVFKFRNKRGNCSHLNAVVADNQQIGCPTPSTQVVQNHSVEPWDCVGVDILRKREGNVTSCLIHVHLVCCPGQRENTGILYVKRITQRNSRITGEASSIGNVDRSVRKLHVVNRTSR